MQSETTKTYLAHLLSVSLSDLKLAPYLEKIDISVPQSEFGDYSTNAAFVIAKKGKLNPKEVAEKIAAEIKKNDNKGVFEEISIAGGFINFRISQAQLLKNTQIIIDQGDLFGCSLVGKGEKILVEYFQPNVAKPLHLGHLRTAIIGDALFRIFASQGFKAESDTHLGDWGTQFGLLILGFKKYGEMKAVEKDPITELNKLYVKINFEAEKNPEIHEAGKAEFLKLESGDAENRKLWKLFRDWTWKEFEIIYSDLGVRRSDHDWGESFYEDKMPAVLAELKSSGLLKDSQGAQIVDLEQHNLGIALVVKSDGGTTYLLRDLATFIYRKSQGFKKQFYVVDVRQKHTLAQTFKVLELLGHIQSPQEAVHIAYGFLTLPEGAMSTRKGLVVGATDFVKGVQEIAQKIIEEKNPDLKNKEQVAKSVAAAAIKYFDLSHNLNSDIVFDPKTAITFEGNTGPYLQYTHARIHGILRKNQAPSTKHQINSNDQILNSLTTQETAVLRKLIKFPEIVEQVAKDYLPNSLCNYLFELSQTFNAFYHEVPVTQEKDEELKAFRLNLITATAQVIRNGLYLLGIEAPEEM